MTWISERQILRISTVGELLHARLWKSVVHETVTTNILSDYSIQYCIQFCWHNHISCIDVLGPA